MTHIMMIMMIMYDIEVCVVTHTSRYKHASVLTLRVVARCIVYMVLQGMHPYVG